MSNIYHLKKSKNSPSTLLLMLLPSFVFIFILAIYFLTSDKAVVQDVNNNIQVEVLGESDNQK